MRPLLERAQRLAVETSPLCSGLSAADVDTVLSRARLVDYAADRVVLTEGQPPTGLHVVVEGLVEVRLVRADEGVLATIPLGQIGSGGVFGEYSSWDPRPVNASVVTLTPTRLLVLPVRDFLQLIDEHDHIGKVVLGNLLRMLIHRLRVKNAQLDATLLPDFVGVIPGR